jgi:hypothetical protein
MVKLFKNLYQAGFNTEIKCKKTINQIYPTRIPIIRMEINNNNNNSWNNKFNNDVIFYLKNYKF